MKVSLTKEFSIATENLFTIDEVRKAALRSGYLNDERIGRVCHEANRAFCAAIGEEVQPPWEEAPKEMVTSVFKGVKYCREHLDIDAKTSHEIWMSNKTKDGWTYGEIKDAEKKTHPLMIPYDQLPMLHKLKDELFISIVKALVPKGRT